MTIIFFVLPLTLLLSLGAVAAFVWATRSGQFDDLRTPALRALHDAAPQRPESTDVEQPPRATRSPASRAEG